MKGDFTRSTFDRLKHYSRVLKQQGRVDLDADWNEAADISLHLDRTLARDVVGPCGVPRDGDGFRIEPTPAGDDLTFAPGRIYVDGILAEQEGEAPIPITAQPDLPGYLADAGPLEDGVYLVYVDVWDRHVTYIEDPEIRETALGGPDTTTRTRTVSQVRLHRIGDDAPLAGMECEPYPAPESTGRLRARTDPDEDPADPCVVPAAAGYRGLENRLYRVEIHAERNVEDDRPPTFKWSRDNGSVVLPIADAGIDGADVSLRRLGHDDVLTVRVGDWVEVLGETTELHGRHGTLAQVAPDGIDRADLRITLSRSVADHQDEARLKLRRWDHRETDEVALIDGAVPIQDDWFELEDGVQVRFDPDAEYRVGDYWLIPARTREGTVLWPRTGEPAAPAALPPHGIHHHYCTLALARRNDGAWTEVRDCRPLFPPLSDLDAGGCCVHVEPGDDIQRAIDEVVEAGGGCVSLCAGIHVARGALRIRDALDVTIRGQGTATIVHFITGDGEEPGDGGERDDGGATAGPAGGFLVEGGAGITLERFLALGAETRALVTVRNGETDQSARRITLRDLTLLNLSRSDGETFHTCGVRLGQTEEITIRECRIAADIGVLALWGDAIPWIDELNDDLRLSDHADGVTGLRMTDTVIRYSDVGLLIGRGERCRLDRCDVDSVDRGSWSETRDRLTGLPPLDGGAGLAEAGGWTALRESIDPVFERSAADPVGTALLAFVLRDSHLRDCTVAGAHGARVNWWIRGSATGNSVRTSESGLAAFWLHDAAWRQNRVTCENGAALTLAGAHRPRISHNTLRAADGLRNRPFAEGLRELFGFVPILQRGYGAGTDAVASYLVAILLVHESAEIMGLGVALARLDDAVRDVTGRLPVAILLAQLLEQWARTADGQAALPLIDLRVVDNDIAAGPHGIAIDGLIPLGGLRIEGNRIHTITGQAVRVATVRMFANAHIVTLAFRAALDRARRLMEEQAAEVGDALGLELGPLLEELTRLLGEWRRGAESFLESDFRIARNSIRSYRTAVEFDLFEMAVLDNHITMQERRVRRTDSASAVEHVVAGPNSEIVAVLGTLEASPVFEHLAAAMRDGAHTNPIDYANSLASGPLASANLRTATAAVVEQVRSQSTDPVVQESAERLTAALTGDDTVALRAALEAFIAAAQGYVDSLGILARGAGCRIIGNHVLVPADIDPDTEAMGGVQVSVSYLDIVVGAALLQAVGRSLPGDGDMVAAPRTPHFGINETLVADNEIIGGVGHGLAVLAVPGMPEYLENLQIRGNEIRGMGGAGIHINEQALVIGLEITGNRIQECGHRPGFASVRGGVFLRSVALCSIHENRVERCGLGLDQIAARGLDLDTILELRLIGNVVRANGSIHDDVDAGGVRLEEVYGRVSVDQNEMSLNHGSALAWANGARSGEDVALPEMLVQAAARYLGIDIKSTTELENGRASIQGNVFEHRRGAQVPLVRLLNIGELAFSGNTCHAEASAMPLADFNAVTRGVIANNLLRGGGEASITVKKLMEGAVVGNVGDRPIQLSPLLPQIEHGLNVPAVV